MPELPEVETVTRALRPYLLGRRIAAVQTFADKLRAPLEGLHRPDLAGYSIVDVRRRGKYIIVELANCRAILLHLGMTGSCRVVPGDTPRARHEHVLWQLDNGLSWRLDDPRKFGLATPQVLPTPGAEPECLASLGLEPLGPDFTIDYLADACRGRTRPIKNLIMYAAVVVGVGNIYASEALSRAGIHPTTPAGKLARRRCRRLVAAIQDVLRQAIAAGGTTIIDFKGVDGSEGRFRQELAVYGRQGERCRRCDRGIVRRLVMAGRSTFYCACCQR